MKKLLTVTALVAVIVSFTGCRTTERVLKAYEADMTVGAYGAAATEVSDFATGESPWWNCFCPWRWSTFGAASSDETSITLWQLMYGSALYMNGQKDAAIQQFDKAEDSFIRNDKTSVFAQAGTGGYALMSNDRVLTYDGGGQDRIFTCLYKAIDFASDGNVNAARTELNRAAQHQENWLYERRKDVQAAAEKMEKDASAAAKEKGGSITNRSAAVNNAMNNKSFGTTIFNKTGFNPATSGDLDTLAPKDYMNVYVQHVCGIFRWINGDGGATYLRDAAALRPDVPQLAADAKEARAQIRPKNQVWIYVEDGLCPAREEWRLDLPMFCIPVVNRYVKYAGMALPYLRERCNGAANYTVTCNGSPVLVPEIANIDKLVHTEYDVYMRGALTREITRVIVKAGAQAALGAAAEHASDWRAQYALQASQWAVAAWAMTTTAADLRSWTALPKSVRMIRVTRPTDGIIDLQADSQPVRILVPEGNTLVFIRKPGPMAIPMTKMITIR